MIRYRVMVQTVKYPDYSDEYDGILYASHDRAKEVLRAAEGDPNVDIAWIDALHIPGDDDGFDRCYIPIGELGEEDDEDQDR